MRIELEYYGRVFNVLTTRSHHDDNKKTLTGCHVEQVLLGGGYMCTTVSQNQ